MTTGLPSRTQLIELLGAEFARAGYEIEDVVVEFRGARTRLPQITVIADGDTALDLDTVAALSRSASALLDGWDGLDGIGERYVLEVTSPGVDRPLTSEKHFRRARGRKVELVLADGSQLTGRIGAIDGDLLSLVVPQRRNWVMREIPLAEIVKAVVQVEFSPPAPAELELAELAEMGRPRGREAGA